MTDVLLGLSGPPHVCLPGSTSPVPLAPRDALLLAWLALEGPTPRQRLATLLWPDSAPDVARNALRQRLFQLKKQLGRVLVDGTSSLQLPAGVGHDLGDVTLHGLLTGVDHEITGELAQWLQHRRDARRAEHRREREARADAAEASHNWAEALEHAATLLNLDPLSEGAHRRLMRLHYLAGDRAAALLAFDACERVLKDEVGTRPGADTLALLDTIEHAAPPAMAAGSVAVPACLLRPPRLVGRDAEQASLAAAWHAGRVAAVSGEAGMGKSRLLQAFASSRPGVVQVAARPGDGGVPFATVARLLRAVLIPAVGPPVALPAAHRDLLARLLPELGDTLTDRVQQAKGLPLQRAVAAALQACNGLAGVLLDDLHFADDASLELLPLLIGGDAEPERASARDLRWALAYRPAEAGSSVALLQDALAEHGRLHSVPLQPLDEPALAQLLDSLALPGVSGAALAPAVHRRTGGNPLFVLETLKQAWVDDRLAELVQVAEVGDPVRASGLPRPASVTLLIERRIRQLSPAALALARVAVIAGVDFDIALAEHVLRMPALLLADPLNELEAAQVMRGNSFAHDLVFEAVASGVPATIAAHAHAQVAGWLEARGSEPARLAQHWIAAGQGTRALPWLDRAADAARRALRSKECVAFLQTKSAIESEEGDREAAFESLLRAAEEFMDTDLGSEASLRFCDQLSALAANPRQRVLAQLQRAHLHQQRGEFEACSEAAFAALDEAQPLGDAGLLALAQRQAGMACNFTHRQSEALAYLKAAAQWYDGAGDDLRRSEVQGELAMALDNAGRLDDALPHHHAAFELARRSGQLGHAAFACSNYACNRLDAGDLEAAEHSLQQGQQLLGAYDEFGANRGLQQMLRALALSHLGRYDQALDQAELGLASTRQFQPGFLAFAQLRLASVWWHLGQWARVAALLAQAPARDDWPVPFRVLRARLVWYAAAAAGKGLAAGRQGLRAESEALAAGERPDLRLPLVLELADAAAPRAALSTIDRVRDEALGIGHRGTVLAATVRAAAVAAPFDPGRARAEADAAMALASQGCQTTALLPAELWLQTALAALASGDEAVARQRLQHGRDWLRVTARDHVPGPFRDGFLQRNPVNRALLALASRTLD